MEYENGVEYAGAGSPDPAHVELTPMPTVNNAMAAMAIKAILFVTDLCLRLSLIIVFPPN